MCLIFFHFLYSNVRDNKCHKQKWRMLFSTRIKPVAHVLACPRAIAHIKWRVCIASANFLCWVTKFFELKETGKTLIDHHSIFLHKYFYKWTKNCFMKVFCVFISRQEWKLILVCNVCHSMLSHLVFLIIFFSTK